MKKLILAAAIVAASIFMGPSVKAGCEPSCGLQLNFLCFKKKVCTEEVCRRYFCKTKCVCGCPKTIRFVEITYKTTYRDCCGECSFKTYKVTKRCGNWDCEDSAGAPVTL